MNESGDNLRPAFDLVRDSGSGDPCVGLYGTVCYNVAQQTNEIGGRDIVPLSVLEVVECRRHRRVQRKARGVEANGQCPLGDPKPVRSGLVHGCE